MTTWNRRAIVLVVIAYGVGSAACGDGPFAPGAPTAPSANPQQPAAALISGVVSDSLSRPVAGARVEVVDGPQARLSRLRSTVRTFPNTTRPPGSRLRATTPCCGLEP